MFPWIFTPQSVRKTNCNFTTYKFKSLTVSELSTSYPRFKFSHCTEEFPLFYDLIIIDRTLNLPNFKYLLLKECGRNNLPTSSKN